MVKLTKKFENEGMVGQDPAQGLQRALDRQKGNVRSPLLQAPAAWLLMLAAAEDGLLWLLLWA